MSKVYCKNCKFFKPFYNDCSDVFECKAKPSINYVTGETNYQMCDNAKGACELYEHKKPNWITRSISKLFNRKDK